MAGNATLIPQSIRSALKKGNIPDHEKWNFIDALMEYDLTGTIPNFSNANLAMLFESYKSLIDANNAKYWEKTQRLAIVGAAGGSVRSETKTAAARRNGAKGGAPKGNRNAAKNHASDNELEKQPKQMLRLSSNEKTTQAVIDIDIDVKDSGNNRVVLEKQPTTTIILNFLNESKKAGFTLDKKIAEKILRENPIDPTWQKGPFCFTVFVANVITDLYSDKSPAEQKRLFISAFHWEDLREDYPAWRQRCIEVEEARRLKEAVEAEERRKDEAWRNRPVICGHCEAVLASDDRVCPSCSWMPFFDEESEAWKFHEPVNLSAEFRQHIAGTKL